MYEKGRAGKCRGRWHPRSQKFSNKGLVTITSCAFRKLAREWSPLSTLSERPAIHGMNGVSLKVASREQDNDNDFTTVCEIVVVFVSAEWLDIEIVQM